ncbi:MAG: SIS domain-containing protein [Sandaracinaceae bacterium]
MCGVIGLVCEHHREDLGVVAGALLEALQYRGYDSCGAAVQGESTDDVTLLKGVGAPSVLVPELGIDKLAGRVFCGQVRWATFGVVDELNAQPHVVRCKTFLYGAHNGNVTNCDALKQHWSAAGHAVLSDNDGEMVVHSVEHCFAEELAELADPTDRSAREDALLRAIRRASAMLEGSFAAVVVDPLTHTAVAIKRGSSLYFGFGEDSRGKFGITSSDLSSVLGHTHVLVPLAEGEMVLFTADRFEVYGIESGERLERAPARSRLRVEDAVLQPPFETFMAQEIHAQPETVQDALSLFQGGHDASRRARDAIAHAPAEQHAALEAALERLRAQYDDHAILEALSSVAALPIADALRAAGADATSFASAERAFFSDAAALAPTHRDLVHGLDGYIEAREVTELARGVEQTVIKMVDALNSGGRIYLVCCGTSYHAAKAACLFFAELAGVDVVPLLPGEFRGQYALTLRDGDLFVSISQSGETKDLIDVLNLVLASKLDIGRVAIVNNLNSTLAQEKSEVVVPLRCGPEIAVPATKSFLNQLTVLYGLAKRLGEVRGRDRQPWPDLPALVAETLEMTRPAVEEASEAVFLAPSMHLLAVRLLAVAKEGALKVREVVLNHTEGFEGSEFKHGPNTILGFNTLFGPHQVQALLDRVASEMDDAEDPTAFVRDALRHSMDALYADYPLVFICGPERRDVDLTISQVNTHKIRGALPIMIAEEDPRLRAAVEKAPGDGAYRSVYIPLPKTGDTLQTVFSASVALQLLALRMSERKMAHLEAMGLKDHGVHPDVPKNVSKSITVD